MLTRSMWITATGILAAGLLAGAATAGDAPAANQVAQLVIDYGDGVEKHFTSLPWKTGATVFDLLKAADKHPRGLALESKDYGPQVGHMIVQIDDQKNAGGGSGARNWVYRVNGELATKACDRYELRAGDEVRWTFEHIRM